MREYLLNLLDQGKSLSVEEICVYIAMAAVLGLVIYLSYWITHAGTIYSRKFNVSLIMLTVLTCTVMLVIGNNVALSLGMVGALSIVRYRTAIKDSRDTAYIFWAIIAGICCGAGDYLIAAIGSAVVFVILLLLGRIRSDTRRLLIIRGARNTERSIEAVVFEFFSGKANLRVKNTTNDWVEFIYELTSRQIDAAAKKGKFITFEGCDGCGKSTQLAMLDKYLSQREIPHLFTREPGGGKISEAIRAILLDGANAEMTDECEALLYAAARVQHLHDRVAPALEEGKLVICDRYVDSSVAYQAGGRGLPGEFVRAINARALEFFLPDATVFIDLSPEEAFRRKHGADENDRLEQAGMDFHRRVYAEYKKLAAEFPGRILSVDGRKSPDALFEDVLSALRSRGCL